MKPTIPFFFLMLAAAFAHGQAAPSAPPEPAAPTPEAKDPAGGERTRRGGPGMAGMNLEQFAQRNDKNGDGRITREEFAGMPQMFNRMDADGDGIITAEELGRMRESFGGRPGGGNGNGGRPGGGGGDMRKTVGQRLEGQGVTVGQPVPDAEVFTLDGEAVRLASLWSEKPLVLVTASITCPIAVDQCPSLEALRREHDPRVNFAVLYVREAHPDEAGGEIRAGDATGFGAQPQPSTLEDRRALATLFARQFSGTAPVYVAGMDNRLPQMLGTGANTGLLIDREGRVVAKLGWYEPGEMAEAIATLEVKAPTP